MKITKEYTKKLKHEQEKMWQYCEDYKNRIEYPLHPDTEMNMKNSWLTDKIIECILKEKNNTENEVVKTLKDWNILFRKHTILNNTAIMIDIPNAYGVYKVLIKTETNV